MSQPKRPHPWAHRRWGRFLRRGLAGAGLLTAAVISTAGLRSPGTPDVVKAGQFQVVDAKGVVRGTFGLSATGVRMEFLGPDTRTRMVLESDDAGSQSVTLFADKSTARVRVFANNAGEGGVVLGDGDGRTRGSVWMLPGGSVEISILDKENKDLVTLPARR